MAAARPSSSRRSSAASVPARPKQETVAPAAERVVTPKRAAPAKASTATPAAVTPSLAPGAPSPKSSGVVLRTLTEEERSARAHALADARLREAEERKIAEEEPRLRHTREETDRVDRVAAEARKRDEEERRKHDEETKRKADEVAKKRFGAETDAAQSQAPPARSLEADEEEAPRTARRGGVAVRPAPPPKAPRCRRKAPRPADRRDRLSADEVRERSVASFRRRVQRMIRPPRQRAERKDRPRSYDPGNDHRSGTGQPHGRARRRCDPHPDAAGSHGEDHRYDRRRYRPAHRRGTWSHRAARRRVGRRRGHVRCSRRSGKSAAARSGGHHHGPRRSRQDVIA